MTGTQLRGLTTNLWATSKVVFRLEDGTFLEVGKTEIRQTGECKKDMMEGVEVYHPSAPPVLILTLSPKSKGRKSPEPLPNSSNDQTNPSTEVPGSEIQPSELESKNDTDKNLVKGVTEQEKVRYPTTQLALDRFHGRTEE